ncbi:MAG TPA: DUF4340 domain-containing protein [Steroidobacteraceae bacterium]|nr:DUF4340 domain-containing protein [Steroidobacteraceae bacterium]
MSSRRLVVLLVLGLLVIAGAIWLSLQRSLPRDTMIARHVLPALAGALNDVTGIKVVKAGDKTTVTLKRGSADWAVGERSDYPADSSKVRKLLIDLSQLETVEEKTSDPKRYGQLAVEDVKDPKATGALLEITGLKQPQQLIVGKTSGMHSAFVRVPSQAQSYLATPQISVDSEPANWLDRSLLDIAATRVQEAHVRPATGPAYTAKRDAREQTDFTVADLPKGRALSSPTAANSASSALAGFTFDDVRALAPDENWNKDTAQTDFRLFDGTTITVQGRTVDDKHWVRIIPGFDAALNQKFAPAPSTNASQSATAPKPAAADATKPAAPDATKPATADATKPAAPAATAPPPPPGPPAKSADQIRGDSEALTKRVSNWVYQVPGYKYDTIFRPLEQILQPLPEKPAKPIKPTKPKKP